MLIRLDTLRERLHGVVLNKGEQGHEIEGLQDELDNLPDSYDSLIDFSKKLSSLKIRSDWPYIEPNAINDILNEMDLSRPKDQMKEIDLDDSAKRVEAAFIGSLCGCMLGKPLEAHKLFGRNLMGNPVEQMKYQSLANLHIFFEDQKEVTDYKRWLNLETATIGVEYNANGIVYRREILASAPDQVIMIRFTANQSGKISFLELPS